MLIKDIPFLISTVPEANRNVVNLKYETVNFICFIRKRLFLNFFWLCFPAVFIVFILHYQEITELSR